MPFVERDPDRQRLAERGRLADRRPRLDDLLGAGRQHQGRRSPVAAQAANAYHGGLYGGAQHAARDGRPTCDRYRARSPRDSSARPPPPEARCRTRHAEPKRTMNVARCPALPRQHCGPARFSRSRHPPRRTSKGQDKGRPERRPGKDRPLPRRRDRVAGGRRLIRKCSGRTGGTQRVQQQPRTERTLVLIKPDAVRRGLVGEVLARFERKGLAVEALVLRTMDAGAGRPALRRARRRRRSTRRCRTS